MNNNAYEGKKDLFRGRIIIHRANSSREDAFAMPVEPRSLSEAPNEF
jgi:hypothetical protein